MEGRSHLPPHTQKKVRSGSEGTPNRPFLFLCVCGSMLLSQPWDGERLNLPPLLEVNAPLGRGKPLPWMRRKKKKPSFGDLYCRMSSFPFSFFLSSFLGGNSCSFLFTSSISSPILSHAASTPCLILSYIGSRV